MDTCGENENGNIRMEGFLASAGYEVETYGLNMRNRAGNTSTRIYHWVSRLNHGYIGSV